MITVHWLKVFAVAVAAFTFGLAICNTIWVFSLSQHKRKNSDKKAPKTNRSRDDR